MDLRGDSPQPTPARMHSIRSRLVMLVTVCVLPAAVLVFAFIAYAYSQARDEMARDTLATAQALVGAVDHDLDEIASELNALAAMSDTGDGFGGLRAQALNIVRAHRLAAIALVDADLRVRMTTSRASVVTLSPEARATLDRAFETKQSVVGDLSPQGFAGQPTVAVAVPVLRGETVPYVLVAYVGVGHLSEMLVGQRLPRDWIGAIFDSSGTIVARTHEAPRFVGSKGAPTLLARMREAPSGAVETTTLEGIPVLSVFSTSPASHWTLALGIPISHLEAPLRRSLGWLVAGTIGWLACTLAIAWALADRIASAVQRLVEPARRLGRGERVQVPALDIREANDVALALAGASAMLADARHRANHDPLTTLANRALFSEQLSQRLDACARTGARLVLALIDLDGFKRINDVHGHAVGDEVLRLVANRIIHGIRESDVAARLGGDEFAVVVPNVGLQDAMPVFEKLLESLSRPYRVDSLTLRLSASIGIAAYPESATTGKALLQRADEALYAAKRAGKRRYWIAEGAVDAS